MSKRRLVITAVLAGQSQSEVARTYGVSQGWISRLMARYRAEGDAAFEPRSRAPLSSPNATPPETLELILRLRNELVEAGLDAGADTLGWHLTHHHQLTVSRATINRILVRAGTVTPDPSKRPKSSYLRFEAEMPNETWQSDFTHYRLTDGTRHVTSRGGIRRIEEGTDVEILTWLDDCSRYALSVTAHAPVTGPIVLATFRQAAATHGFPASTLTDNGLVFTTRFAGGKGGRNHLEHELGGRGIRQKNGKPNHPQTQGKAERFQQTLKKWLRAQPVQPTTLAELQTLLDEFVELYNTRRPHRSLPHRATPATVYTSLPKATPSGQRQLDTHDRVRHDKIDKAGSVTLRVAGRLRHIGVGRTYARTDVILLVQDLHVTVVNAATGEILRDLIIDLRLDYQPTGRTKK
ncbi:MAG TPA: IS481 family transposase [Aeromicrobium sp.]|nr:IS481 family transposase [Aeromicrobium sp.]